MATTEKQENGNKVAYGDLSQRVGVEILEARGLDVELLKEKLIDSIAAEFALYRLPNNPGKAR
jgi:hypothetical protein